MMHEVFLSYSSSDKKFADAICHQLESASIRCWVAPRDIRPSEDWAEAIINAMDQASIFVLVFSSHSNSSAQVRREVERAVNKGLYILPFRIENVPLSKSMEYFISSQHWLDAMTGDLDAHLAHLRDSILVVLKRVPAAAPTAERTVALPAAPGPDKHASSGHHLAPELLASVEILLARVLGPIAKHLLKRISKPGMTPQELVSLLSQHIDDERERKQFVATSTSVIGNAAATR
jgi:hypothetical protein